MDKTLHLISGDGVRNSLAQARLQGEVFVWHDVLYDGPRSPGWPDEDTLHARAAFLNPKHGTCVLGQDLGLWRRYDRYSCEDRR